MVQITLAGTKKPGTKKTGTKKGAEAPSLYPRAESNRNRQNRNLKFYPLNYKGMYIDAKIDKFIYKR